MLISEFIEPMRPTNLKFYFYMLKVFMICYVDLFLIVVRGLLRLEMLNFDVVDVSLERF
jgi:hypothetical protein